MMQTIHVYDASALYKAAQNPSIKEIILHAGTYYLESPILLEDRHALTIQGEKDVKLVGGFPAKLQWKHDRENIYSAKLKTENTPDGVYIAGKKYRMARFPHYDPSVQMLNGYDRNALSFAEQCANPAGAYLHGVHAHLWGSKHFQIMGKNADGSLTIKGGWQLNNDMPMHEEYRYVENLYEALGADGEFYYDQINSVLYICSNAVPCSEAEIITNPYLLKFDGCTDIQIMGITFGATARTFMAPYDRLLRSDWNIHRSGCVLFNNSEQLHMHNCTFSECGTNALFFNGHIDHARITTCLFQNLDAGCINFVGTPDCVRDSRTDFNTHAVEDLMGIGPISENYPRDCIVEDCLMQNFGRVEKQVAGIQISMSARITVRRCTICRCPRAAVNIGEGTFGGHVIEYCNLFDTVWETGDHGSFNGWGRDRFWRADNMSSQQQKELARRDMVESNYIRYNRIRCGHGWDIDLDDGCSYYIVEGNLCLNGGIKLREGYCRTVRNNICVNNTIHVHVWYEDSGDIITNNIVFAPYYPIQMPEYWGKIIDRNILHCPDTSEIRDALPLQELSKQDTNSLICNAQFRNPEEEDYYVLNPEIAKIGFTQPAISEYGVTSQHLRLLIEKSENTAGNNLTAIHKREIRKLPGISIKNVEGDSEISAYGVSTHCGCVVVEIDKSSPLWSAGVKKGDLILTINDIQIEDCDALASYYDNIGKFPASISAVHAGGEKYLASVRK